MIFLVRSMSKRNNNCGSVLFDRSDKMGDDPPTCLVVSHRRTALQRADHIIVLKDGTDCR